MFNKEIKALLKRVEETGEEIVSVHCDMDKPFEAKVMTDDLFISELEYNADMDIVE